MTGNIQFGSNPQGAQIWIESLPGSGNIINTGTHTLSVTVSGGYGTLTYRWYDGSTYIGSGNSISYNLSPGSHTIMVEVTDQCAPQGYNSSFCSATVVCLNPIMSVTMI